jgi:hypothetical protein
MNYESPFRNYVKDHFKSLNGFGSKLQVMGFVVKDFDEVPDKRYSYMFGYCYCCGEPIYWSKYVQSPGFEIRCWLIEIVDWCKHICDEHGEDL